MFWKSLWEKSDEGNPNTTWVKEYENLFSSIIPEIDCGNIDVTKSMVWNAIKKKRNWSASGPDGIVNF